jgi:aspartyl protease family protein
MRFEALIGLVILLVSGMAFDLPSHSLGTSLPMGTLQTALAQVGQVSGSYLTWHKPNPMAGLPQREHVSGLPEVLRTPAQQISVPLIGDREQGLQVTVRLNHRHNTRFLLDTGATYTIISPALARQLGIDTSTATQYVTLATANGTTQAPLVEVDDLALDGYHVKNIAVVVRSLGHDDLAFEGLLGLNFFKGTDLTITQDRLMVSTQA